MSKEEVDARCYPLAKDELAGQIHNLIEQAGRVNGLICGANQVTKQMNHGKATLVVLAANCRPLEIILHLVLVCEDKGVPYVFVPSQETIGNCAGINRPVAACCFTKEESIQPGVQELI